MLLTRFILIEPSHAGNVGAVARAMKTMGFADLVLVRPRWSNVLRREETIQRASGALDVLANCRIVDSLDEAVQGLHYLCATAMTPRDFGPPTATPRAAFPRLLDSLKQTQQTGADSSNSQAEIGIGLLFGNERYGMKNEDVYRCHLCLHIPSNPAFGSLNLASAVQVLAYEWSLALRESGLASWAHSPDPAQHQPRNAQAPQAAPTYAEAPAANLADASQISATLAHWQAALQHIGYLDPQAPKKLMPRLNTLFNRALLRQEEINILRGIAKAMLQTQTRPDPTPLPQQDEAGLFMEKTK